MDENKKKKEGLKETKKVFDVVANEKDPQKYNVKGAWVDLKKENKK